MQTVDEAEMKALRHSAEWLKRDRFVAGIWQGNLFIGEIWIEPAKWEVPSFEIGWFIDKGYEGRGLGYEAAKACLGFIWDELDAHKIIAITDDTNARSYRLAERLGFRKEGHERESGFKDGKRFGRITYGLLKSDMS
jgi:RimJ/RimL family protein N-acetyltransferase